MSDIKTTEIEALDIKALDTKALGERIELLESRLFDGRIQELIYRPTLH